MGLAVTSSLYYFPDGSGQGEGAGCVCLGGGFSFCPALDPSLSHFPNLWWKEQERGPSVSEEQWNKNNCVTLS